MTRRSLLSLILLASLCNAREWRSADGARTLQGDFAGLANDQVAIKTSAPAPLVMKLDALSPEDQAFARAAQMVKLEAAKLGPKSFEVTRVFSKGALCRMAIKVGNGSVLFTGEQFLLMGNVSSAKRGMKLKDQILYPAGQRTFHPTQGDAQSMRAFALKIDDAVMAAKDTAEIYEPVLEVLELRGVGVAVGEAGFVLTDSEMVNGATSIDVDVGNDRVPATVVANDAALGVSLLQLKAELTPVRLLPRSKMADVGQPVSLVCFSLSTRGRSLADPEVTDGLIKQVGGPSDRKDWFFETNAPREGEALGGVALGARGDLIGFLRATPRVVKGKRPATSAEAPGPSVSNLCVRSEAVAAFLKTVSKGPAPRAANSANVKDATELMKKATLQLRVFKETVRETKAPEAPVKKPSTPKKTTKAKKTDDKAMNAPPAAAKAWSLSKSGVRHNDTCRYYNAGMACGATDGSPCKLCGG